MTKLKRCPCGEYPTKIRYIAESSRYSTGYPDCCGEWEFEFRTPRVVDQQEVQELGNDAWNTMPRFWEDSDD